MILVSVLEVWEVALTHFDNSAKFFSYMRKNQVTKPECCEVFSRKVIEKFLKGLITCDQAQVELELINYYLYVKPEKLVFLHRVK